METPLGAFGASVLGYDSHSGRLLPTSPCDGFSDTAWHAATEEPRRYGFHATLKAPFRLKQEGGERDLVAGLRALAARCKPVTAGPLEVAAIGAFIALRPRDESGALGELAQACVEHFGPWRAALSDEEIQRRRPERLTARQRELLDLYGYPYVAEQYRFHMTLTGPLDPAARVLALSGLADRTAAMAAAPVVADHIALLRQDSTGAAFRVITSAALAAA
jgi:hypothetical protein